MQFAHSSPSLHEPPNPQIPGRYVSGRSSGCRCPSVNRSAPSCLALDGPAAPSHAGEFPSIAAHRDTRHAVPYTLPSMTYVVDLDQRLKPEHDLPRHDTDTCPLTLYLLTLLTSPPTLPLSPIILFPSYLFPFPPISSHPSTPFLPSSQVSPTISGELTRYVDKDIVLVSRQSFIHVNPHLCPFHATSFPVPIPYTPIPVAPSS